MHLPLFIAKRYLLAKKSSNVINIISLISAIGIGIGCMALIIILSVYNGFDHFIRSRYESFQPDFIVTPRSGKILQTETEAFSLVRNLPQVQAACPVIEENVAVQYNDNHAIATIKGIDSTFAASGKLTPFLTEGEFIRYKGEIPHAVIGKKLAQDLQLRVRFLSPLDIYFPDRKKEVSLINPASGLRSERLYPGGILSLDTEFDKNYIFVPIETASRLIGYRNGEATSVEIYLKIDGSGTLPDERTALQAEKEIRRLLGENYTVKNRYMQNEVLYKMMRSEKFAVYLILFFIILIISVNVFGSLSLLMLEKQNDLETYKSMGAPRQLLKKIFIYQGWLISLSGAIAGIVLGLVLSGIQQKFGIISIPGNYLVSAYPVMIQWEDSLITFAGVAFIGYLIARIPASVIK